MTRIELLERLASQGLDRPLAPARPARMTVQQVMEAIWPLGERFRPHLAAIRTIRYDAAHEPAADMAVERMLLQDCDWADEPPAVWRVLLERYLQAQMLLLHKASSAGKWGTPLMSVPEPASPALRSRLAAALLLHSTPLPFPAEDRSGAELPGPTTPARMTRH